MKVRDAKALRQEYNEHYKQPHDKWSCSNHRLAQQIVNSVLNETYKFGFKITKGMRSLDVGCAKGYIAEAFRLVGFESHGLDYSDVAIDIAKNLFPQCSFKHMDGFNPCYEINFDFIFVRGFSGANTHDLDFVANFSNQYVDLLNKAGLYVLGFTSNFSGDEKEGETVNWTYEELDIIGKKIKAERLTIFFYPKRTIINRTKKFIRNVLTGNSKDYFYLIFKK
jgi:hypothetical protein